MPQDWFVVEIDSVGQILAANSRPCAAVYEAIRSIASDGGVHFKYCALDFARELPRNVVVGDSVYHPGGIMSSQIYIIGEWGEWRIAASSSPCE